MDTKDMIQKIVDFIDTEREKETPDRMILNHVQGMLKIMVNSKKIDYSKDTIDRCIIMT